MTRQTINFWVLFTVSIILAALLVSVFVKALKFILMLILVLALAPIIYFLLKLILPGSKNTKDQDEIQKRD